MTQKWNARDKMWMEEGDEEEGGNGNFSQIEKQEIKLYL